MTSPTRLTLLSALLLLISAPALAAAEEVRITLSDYKITSTRTTFTQGVPYRFVVVNAVQREHEWVILPRGVTNTKKALLEVEEDDLKPGQTATRTFTFKKAGNFEFSCHIGRHYRKGMLLPIVVQ
ncbi:cupredoxin domain-containing protein [Anthocerotibacter panamensis]|uniref:cupredoxin domain-containing protein n=1 Tax=Anthocerotibacter panamensis TaxID=2857077 RepID=UPI001C40280B|nr:cupredoxin domain-containing protein [Anthocerotibacter panamensis]